MAIITPKLTLTYTNPLYEVSIGTFMIQCARLVHDYMLSLTLSMCGCQYSSCWVFASVLLILEKKVGLVRYIRVGSKSKVSAITAWIRSRTFLTAGNTHKMSD